MWEWFMCSLFLFSRHSFHTAACLSLSHMHSCTVPIIFSNPNLIFTLSIWSLKVKAWACLSFWWCPRASEVISYKHVCCMNHCFSSMNCIPPWKKKTPKTNDKPNISAPKVEHSPWKMVVGRVLSYWVPVTFQGRAVELREGLWLISCPAVSPHFRFWRLPCNSELSSVIACKRFSLAGQLTHLWPDIP